MNGIHHVQITTLREETYQANILAYRAHVISSVDPFLHMTRKKTKKLLHAKRK